MFSISLRLFPCVALIFIWFPRHSKTESIWLFSKKILIHLIFYPKKIQIHLTFFQKHTISSDSPKHTISSDCYEYQFGLCYALAHNFKGKSKKKRIFWCDSLTKKLLLMLWHKRLLLYHDCIVLCFKENQTKITGFFGQTKKWWIKFF